MRASRPSTSAQAVTLARAHLHDRGAINDPLAADLLTRRRRLTRRVLRVPVLRRAGASATFAFLAARTLFFDDFVRRAVEGGIRQVVIVGAGYDSRPHRMDLRGVQWVELDHPATQAAKRAVAPGHESLEYVAIDLTADPIGAAIRSTTLDLSEPVAFLVEGLTMYLSEMETRALFAGMASSTVPGSVMAANFTSHGGGSSSPLSRVAAFGVRAMWHFNGEPTVAWASRSQALASMSANGWTVEETLTGPEVGRRYLHDPELTQGRISPHTLCAVAVRPRP